MRLAAGEPRAEKLRSCESKQVPLSRPPEPRRPSGTAISRASSDVESSCRHRTEKLEGEDWPSDPSPVEETEAKNLQYPRTIEEPREWASFRWWAKVVRARAHYFCPAWYSVTMGTGMVGNLMLLSPWEKVHSVLRWPGLVLVLFDTVLFVLFLLLSLVRYMSTPSLLYRTWTHPTQSLYLGTPAMSLNTVFSGLLAVGESFNVGGLGGSGKPSYGIACLVAAMWWLTVLIALLVVIGVPYSMVHRQRGSLERTQSLWLLPIVTPITTANAGATFSDAVSRAGLGGASWAMTMCSYALLGVGVVLSLMLMVLYLQRLLLFGPPDREQLFSTLLPLGPCGQGSDGLIHLGASSAVLLPMQSASPDAASLGRVMHGTGLVLGTLLWALGLWWFALAILGIAKEVRRGSLEFNMGFWALTFPLGTMAMSTNRLGLTLDSTPLRVGFGILFGLDFVFWLRCAVPTARGFMTGGLLVAPDLE